MNTKLIKFAFFIIVIFSIFSIAETIKTFHGSFKISQIFKVHDPIVVNLVFKDKIPSQEVLGCFGDFCKSSIPEASNNVYTLRFSGKNDDFYKNNKIKIRIGYDTKFKDIKNNLELIDMHIGSKDYYYSDKDIKNLKEETVSFQTNALTKDLKKIKVLDLGEKNYYRGCLNDIVVSFLSLFYNWKYFIIPYIWLFVAFLLFSFNKEVFNFKFKIDLEDNKTNYIILGLIILIGAIARINGISYFKIYGDELYTKAIAIKSLISCFQDAGNPPLFFILEYIVSKIFSDSLLCLRALPYIFGVLFIPAVYLLLKDYSKQLALFGAFFASINIINIVQSQEARVYGLGMLLVVLCIYFLFKYLKNTNIKNLSILTIINALLINSHYYLILFVITNYVWALFDLAEQKKPKEILKYTISNIISALTLTPFLIISAKVALSDGFNSWIPAFTKKYVSEILNFYFVNKYFLIITAVIAVLNIVAGFTKFGDKKKNNLLIYLAYSLFGVCLSALIITLYVKPIIHGKILLAIYSILFLIEILLIATTLDKIENDKMRIAKIFYSIIMFFMIISITHPPIKHILTINPMMEFIKHDAVRYHKDYDIHVILPNFMEYKDSFEGMSDLNFIKWHVVDANKNEHYDDIGDEKLGIKHKKTIVYISTVGLVKTIGMETFPKYIGNKNAYIFKSNVIPTLKMVWE